MVFKLSGALSRTVMLMLVFVAGILIFTSFTLSGLDKGQHSERMEGSISKKSSRKKDLGMMDNRSSFWRTHDFYKPELPVSALARSNDVKIESKRIEIMGVDTFYREAIIPEGVLPSNQSILLLHGAAFKSQTWVDLKTMNILASLGHRVVAVDLPGFGETKAKIRLNRGDYMMALVKQLSLENTVILSPSMSGSFSFPLIFQRDSTIRGFIPVAPINSDIVKSEDLNKHLLEIPTLIIYGELDKGLGITSKNNLMVLENSQVYELPGAGHPAYLNEPEKFHTLIENFLTELGKRIEGKL